MSAKSDDSTKALHALMKKLRSKHDGEGDSCPDADGADTTVWVVAREPAPEPARLWHDRRPRPVSVLPSTRTVLADRVRYWAWVAGALGLAA